MAANSLPWTQEQLGREALKRFKAREELLAFIKYLMPSYQVKPHHILIAKKLEAVERGEIRRLMVCVGPRSGKSTLVSEFFPAWFFGRNPKLDFIQASYGADLAVSFGRKVRNLLLDPRYANIFPEVTVAKDSQAQDEWHTDKGGAYKAEGVGGGITGYGANCLSGEMIIETEVGPMRMDKLVSLKTKPRVLSWDHTNGRKEYRPILATRITTTQELYEFDVGDKSSLRCTGRHRLYTEERGYQEAENLYSSSRPFTLCGLWGKNQRLQERNLSPVLFSSKENDHRFFLQFLWQDGRKTILRLSQSFKEWASRFVLFVSLFDQASCSQEQKKMFKVSGASSSKIEKILRFLQEKNHCRVSRSQEKSVSVLPAVVLSQGKKNAFLWENLCRQISWDRNERQPDFQIQGWEKHRKVIQKDETIYSFSRQGAMSGMWKNGSGDSRSSYQREEGRQSTRKSNISLRGLPHETSSLKKISLCGIRRVRTECLPVYDLEVEGNHNFFANKILVHNCVALDDVFKGWEDASSPARRKLVWDWYTSELYTRLMPYKDGEGAIVIVATRWHDDDLAGKILAQMQQPGYDQFEVISLPSLAEEQDPLGRQPGEALWEERFPRTVLEKYRQLEPKKFMSLHQQKPVPDEGFYFKLEWLKYYTEKPKYLRIYAASDYATKDKGGDYTVHVVFGIDPNDDLYVLDLWRHQADAQVWVEQAIDWMAKYKPVRWAEERGQIIGGVGPFLVKRMRERKVFCVREQFASTKDKQTRATAIAGRMQQGKFFLPANASWRGDFEWELSRFPDGAFDDQVDACSLIGKMLETMGHGTEPKPEPKVEPLKPVGYSFNDLMGMAKRRSQGKRVGMQGIVVPYRRNVEEIDELVLVN